MNVDCTDQFGEDAADGDARRDRALAIKACLDSLKTDARAFDLSDLERFLELAALAAEEAAHAPVGVKAQLRYAKPMGAC